MEDHFQNEEIVNFFIGKDKFGYKPVTAGEELGWLKECMITNPDGLQRQDQELVTKCKFRNLVEAPYDSELCKKIIGVQKSWSELSHNERWNLIRKMKTLIFDEIINNMKRIDKGSEQEKKEKKT